MQQAFVHCHRNANYYIVCGLPFNYPIKKHFLLFICSVDFNSLFQILRQIFANLNFSIQNTSSTQ